MTFINNIDRRFLVLAWLGLWTSLIAAVGIGNSGCTGTAHAETVTTAPAPIEPEAIEAPIEVHVTRDSLYVVETYGAHETYVVDGITVTVEPGTVTFFN